MKMLGTLLETGQPISQSNDNYKRQYVEEFAYLSAPCTVNGTEYSAVVTIKQTKGNPDKFYHYYLRTKK